MTVTTTLTCDQCGEVIKQPIGGAVGPTDRFVSVTIHEANPGGQGKSTAADYHYAHAPQWVLDELK